MASSSYCSHSEGATADRVISEFFSKSLRIILESRSPQVSSRNFSGEHTMSSPCSSTSSSSSVRPRDKWFNLALRECPATLENFLVCRSSNLEPLVVDVVLVQRPVDLDQAGFSPRRELLRNNSEKEYGWNYDQCDWGFDAKREKVVERWIVQYDNRRTKDFNSPSRRSSSNRVQTLYKKSVLLLRSLFLTVRLLPAYKIFKELNSLGQIQTFKLVPRVTSMAEPFSYKEESLMQKLFFAPVETSCDKLSVFVFFRPSIPDVTSEHSAPMSPNFIPNYVGSPMAEPLKRFPSLPVSHGSPSCLPASRRHSWSFDRYKASPTSFSHSPSPTHSEPNALASDAYSRRSTVPQHPYEPSGVHNKDVYADEYPPLPHFSSTSSPSAPIHIPGRHFQKAPLRTESAPVRIPVKPSSSPGFSTKQTLPPSPPLKLARYHSLKPAANPGSPEIGKKFEKHSYFGKDDTRKHSALRLISNCSSYKSFSRSSSRSFLDDADDLDYPCPFDVEEDDMTDAGSGPGSFDQRGDPCDPSEGCGSFPMKKSQEAAVGALVMMLKKAPPLRPEFPTWNSLSEYSRPDSWDKNRDRAELPGPILSSVKASGLMVSKTTADALEELRCYQDMKNMLLSQSGQPYASPEEVPAAKY